MHYMGGKARIARRLVETMQSHRTTQTGYAEPFVGGGSVFSLMAPTFTYAVGGDVIPDLVLMWNAVARGWVPPETVTREDYYRVKAQPPSALRGFVGFGCSFGGKWWGGWAAPSSLTSNYAAMSRRSVLRQAPGFRGRNVVELDYRLWRPTEGTLVYCDPPYAGTTAYASTERWDHEEFWDVVTGWSNKGALVFVSEYAAPPGWISVWSQSVKVSLSVESNDRPATEHLWMMDHQH
jgi:DNA adenine methylase